jgi:hypothetical protein
MFHYVKCIHFSRHFQRYIEVSLSSVGRRNRNKDKTTAQCKFRFNQKQRWIVWTLPKQTRKYYYSLREWGRIEMKYTSAVFLFNKWCTAGFQRLGKGIFFSCNIRQKLVNIMKGNKQCLLTYLFHRKNKILDLRISDVQNEIYFSSRVHFHYLYWHFRIKICLHVWVTSKSK